MYITTYSMAEAYINAREAGLNHPANNSRPMRNSQAGSNRINGSATNRLSDELTSMGKLLKSKLASSY
jgi:hypothetical protein